MLEKMCNDSQEFCRGRFSSHNINFPEAQVLRGNEALKDMPLNSGAIIYLDGTYFLHKENWAWVASLLFNAAVRYKTEGGCYSGLGQPPYCFLHQQAGGRAEQQAQQSIWSNDVITILTTFRTLYTISILCYPAAVYRGQHSDIEMYGLYRITSIPSCQISSIWIFESCCIAKLLWIW